MKSNKRMISTAVSGLFALGLMTAGNLALAAKEGYEKCHGVAKAGKNDCKTANSSCAGTSKEDGQKDAWVYLPEGTCDKLVGSSMMDSG